MGTVIGLTGDVMLGRLVNERQRHRRPDAVWGSMYEELRACDGLIINLECCLSSRGQQWERTQRVFHFRAGPGWAIPALTRAGVDCCALANNHVLDYEMEALEDTLEALDDAGIKRSGAGRSLEEALEPAVFESDGTRVALVSLTDNAPEYAAEPKRPGTAYMEIDIDNTQTRNRVREALGRASGYDPDIVIASLHWGPNMVEKPPQRFQRFGHWLIEEGVDVIHGHSAHVFHGIEIHDGKPILYDTGDFVDDYAVDERMRNDRGFLFQLNLDPDGEVSALRLTPTEIKDCAVHRANSEVAKWSHERMRSLCEPFETTLHRDGEELVVPIG